jgi:hypothetical protein
MLMAPLSFIVFALCAGGEIETNANDSVSSGRIGVGCWFWSEQEFEQPEGYKQFLDLHAEHAAYELLTTSIRYPVEVTEPSVHDRISAAAAYARERGMGIALDLDVRLARAAFHERYPEEMQEIVRLEEMPLATEGEIRLRSESLSFDDHYTFRARPYDCISSRLLRVYSYESGPSGIHPETVSDITLRCRVEEASTEAVVVAVSCGPEDKDRVACVMTAFTLFSPAVFAPHLVDFERSIMESYADIPLAGVCKDEWGFPGRFDPKTNELWFSRFMAQAYAERRSNRDLVYDMLLMSKGMRGRQGERAAAINHYMEMLRDRNSAIEANFYRNVKEVFGEDAYVGTHSTWFPYPDAREAFKNGLDWWATKRDLAQTDETTPYSIRTALAKKWNSPVWLNMYYAPALDSYAGDIWSHVLGGGRMNFHPLWPSDFDRLTRSLLDSDLLLADARIRLLDFISTAPIDCPVAVFFGHPAFLNWEGDGFADAGLSVADALWGKGIYADLIPSSEIASGAVGVATDGSLIYGPQHYAAAVLYHPQFERPAVAKLFNQVAEGGKTALFRVGDWTLDFDGEPIEGNAALPTDMKALDVAACVEAIARLVDSSGIALQTPCAFRTLHDFPRSMVPERRGVCRLLDGTVILAAGEQNVMGDPIVTSLPVQGHIVEIDAVGIAAVRLDEAGNVAALACGGLRHFKAGTLEITLDQREDIALWRTEGGAWRGVMLGSDGPSPNQLSAFTSDWSRVRIPVRHAPR